MRSSDCPADLLGHLVGAGDVDPSRFGGNLPVNRKSNAAQGEYPLERSTLNVYFIDPLQRALVDVHTDHPPQPKHPQVCQHV